MKCKVCGVEIRSDEELCPLCRELENKVQVLTPKEKQDFSGITIEQDQEKQAPYYDDYHGTNEKQRIYVKQMHFSTGQTGVLTKIILGIIFTGLLIVALPIAFLIISIIVVFLYIMRK